MKKLLFVLLLMPFFASAQESYDLVDFSDEFSGKIIVDDNQENSDLETNCTLNIYQKKNGKLIFSKPALYSEYDFEDSKIKSNIQEIPYGEQSILIFEDFNFDGKEDIALRTGNYGCYGGPSFEIYLADKNGFVYNESFTELGSNYCGMFTVDDEKKQLQTMTKSGCCWHQFSTYVVENNRVVPIEIIEEYYSGILAEYSVQKRVNGKMVTSGYQKFAEGNEPEFTMVFMNGKKMYLIEGMNSDLLYIFTDKQDVVELFIDADFTFNKATQTLTFKNKNTTYVVSDKEITVKDNGKTHHLNKVKQTAGSFNNLKWNTFNNVQTK